MAVTHHVDRYDAALLDDTALYFRQHIHTRRRPTIITGEKIGTVVDRWTSEYLATAVSDTPVSIHVSSDRRLNFLSKNFLYKTLAFDELIHRASRESNEDCFMCADEKYYLRSLGADVRKDKSDIQRQFPKLADDLIIPNYFDQERFFSSVFRISSHGIQIWTHYDTMDNILIQIRGRKRVVLFPPNDALKMYLSGDKSRVIDVHAPDTNVFPDFYKAERYEVTLEPGDILFIPALWFHNTEALGFSVSVNVFWKNLAEGMYDPKDVYGNKDPVPVNRAMQGLDKALGALGSLPEDYRDFYSRMMISRIQEKMLTCRTGVNQVDEEKKSL